MLIRVPSDKLSTPLIWVLYNLISPGPGKTEIPEFALPNRSIML